MDYLNGSSRDAVVSATLDATLAELESRFGTTDMSTWLHDIHWREFNSQWLTAGVSVGAMPARIPHNGNENWNAIMVMDPSRPAMLSIIPDGQSKFVSMHGQASPHYADQVERHRTLDFKRVPVKWNEVASVAEGSPTVLTYTP
ncbi:penicillin acylase family protein [Halopseudomonas pachastrellae]|nr:penicillin acylase family protein [Halopseudomonas pachastrellae]